MKTNTSKKQLVRNRLTQLKKQTENKTKKNNRVKTILASTKEDESDFFWSDVEEFFRTDFQQECF